MVKNYSVATEFNEATCNIVFFESKDDGDVFVDFEVRMDRFTVEDNDWEKFSKMIDEVSFSIENLNYIRKTVDGSWSIHLVNPNGKGDGVIFACYDTESEDVYKLLDLGSIAECYGDCDECDTHCYSFKNDSPWEHKCDCPNYHRCEELWGYDEDDEYNPLWDFRCYCTSINGRESLQNAIDNPTYNY